jgi:hypothetical protein
MMVRLMFPVFFLSVSVFHPEKILEGAVINGKEKSKDNFILLN